MRLRVLGRDLNIGKFIGKDEDTAAAGAATPGAAGARADTDAAASANAGK